MSAALKPFEHTGASANIFYYRERGGCSKPGTSYVWAEVLVDSLHKVDGHWRTKPIPTYRVTVYRERVGEIGRFEHTPASKPKAFVPSARTVTKLVREHVYPV